MTNAPPFAPDEELAHEYDKLMAALAEKRVALYKLPIARALLALDEEYPPSQQFGSSYHTRGRLRRYVDVPATPGHADAYSAALNWLIRNGWVLADGRVEIDEPFRSFALTDLGRAELDTALATV